MRWFPTSSLIPWVRYLSHYSYTNEDCWYLGVPTFFFCFVVYKNKISTLYSSCFFFFINHTKLLDMFHTSAELPCLIKFINNIITNQILASAKKVYISNGTRNKRVKINLRIDFALALITYPFLPYAFLLKARFSQRRDQSFSSSRISFYRQRWMASSREVSWLPGSI